MNNTSNGQYNIPQNMIYKANLQKDDIYMQNSQNQMRGANNINVGGGATQFGGGFMKSSNLGGNN